MPKDVIASCYAPPRFWKMDQILYSLSSRTVEVLAPIGLSIHALSTCSRPSEIPARPRLNALCSVVLIFGFHQNQVAPEDRGNAFVDGQIGTRPARLASLVIEHRQHSFMGHVGEHGIGADSDQRKFRSGVFKLVMPKQAAIGGGDAVQ